MFICYILQLSALLPQQIVIKFQCDFLKVENTFQQAVYQSESKYCENSYRHCKRTYRQTYPIYIYMRHKTRLNSANCDHQMENKQTDWKLKLVNVLRGGLGKAQRRGVGGCKGISKDQLNKWSISRNTATTTAIT